MRYSSSFNEILPIILHLEGGYVNDPNDRGGATNFGITQKTYDNYQRFRLDVLKNVKFITKEEVEEIYYTQYWVKIDGDNLNISIALCLLDFAIHSGVSLAIKSIQKVVGAEIDGVMGISTHSCINNYVRENDCTTLINNICDERMDFLKSLSGWSYYKNGWTNRLSYIRKKSNNLNYIPNEDEIKYVENNKKGKGEESFWSRNNNKFTIPTITSAMVVEMFRFFSGLEGWISCIIITMTLSTIIICLYFYNKKNSKLF